MIPIDRFIFTAALSSVSLISCACKRNEAPENAADRPNVVIITFDTTRADYLSCYGRSGSTTPTLDRLAAEGIRYARCFAAAPITLPSHATILTGLYPFQHGLRDNGMGPLDSQVVTLAEIFKNAGYRTGAVVGAYVLHSRYGLNQGFDFYGDEFSDKIRKEVTGAEFAERDAKSVTDAAVGWLDTIGVQPFFLWAHYFDPHAPYEAPDSPNNANLFESYGAEITYADTQLDRLLQRIDRKSRVDRRNTLILFTADHGEALTDHGEATHAFFVYNETIHVPLIVKLAESKPRGIVVQTPVSIADIVPSIIQWVGLAPPYHLPGQVLPTSEIAGQSEKTARAVYFESHFAFNMYGWSPLAGIVMGDDKYIAAPKPELYDLAADPRETMNLATDRRDQVAVLSDVLTRLQSASETPAFQSTIAEQDVESLRKLRSLGYVSTPTQAPDDVSNLPNPKDMLEVRYQELMAEKELAEGRPERGMQLLETVLERDPDNRQGLRILEEQLTHEKTRDMAGKMMGRRSEHSLPPPFDVTFPAAMGEHHCRNANIGEGIELMTKALAVDPRSPELHQALGICHLLAGRAADAATEFEAALQVEPRLDKALTGLGDAQVLLGDLAEASKYYSAALDVYEADAKVNAKLGRVLRRLGRIEEAGRHLQRALVLDPDLVDIQGELGSLLMEQGRIGDAIAEYETAARRRPENAPAHYDLGLAYLRSDRVDDAIKQFSEAIRLNEDYADAWVNLGIAFMRRGLVDKGRETLLHASRFPQSAGMAFYNLGVAAAQQKNFSETVTWHEKAVAADPPSTAAIEELASYYIREKRIADAVRVLRIGVSAMPDNVKFLNGLAELLSTCQDDSVRNGAESLTVAKRAAELTQFRHPAVLGTLAASYAETGDFDSAADTARKGLELLGADQPTPLRKAMEAQLRLYESGRPYRNPKY